MGTYLPATETSSAETEEILRASGLVVPEGFIERVTGVRSRRVAARDENASDLAAAAAREALDWAASSADEIDLLIFASASHDATEPATANMLQAKLGAANAVTFDVKNACNSFMAGLDVADAYVRLGRARTALVATGEMPSLVTNRVFRSRDDLAENFACLTMGDAGGALILRRAERESQGIYGTSWTNRGEAWRLGTILGGGTMHWGDPAPDLMLLRSNGAELEKHARREIPLVVRAILDAAEWSPESVDVIACHQHTRRFVVEMLGALGLRPDRAPLPLCAVGNCASANIPLALAEAQRQGSLRPDARVLLCGGSAGFSAMAMAVAW